MTAADGELGFALGKAYVKEYFPPEAKARADAMVKNLIAALREDLKTLPWMGEATKKQALEKLDKFNPKIGYPDKWRDYSALQIDRGPYVLNTLRGEEFEFRRQLSKIGKPVDRMDWQMTPPTVNAYYDPLLNEIVFPAGILQPPFFDAQADDAVNYGAMGAVIGHEMTHGFDDQGRKFDASGNLRDWWTADDAKNYDAALQVRRGAVRLLRVRGTARQRQAGPGRGDRGSGRARHRVQGLQEIPRGQARAGQDRRAHGGSALLPGLGARLGGQRPPRAQQAPDEHEPASAAAVPRLRSAFHAAGLHQGLRVQPRAIRWCARISARSGERASRRTVARAGDVVLRPFCILAP